MRGTGECYQDCRLLSVVLGSWFSVLCPGTLLHHRIYPNHTFTGRNSKIGNMKECHIPSQFPQKSPLWSACRGVAVLEVVSSCRVPGTVSPSYHNIVVLSCVWLLAMPWTVIHQAPLSIALSWQEYCSGLPFPPLGDLPDPGFKPPLLCLLHWQADSLSLSHLGSPKVTMWSSNPTPGHISRENSNSKRYMHPNFHSSTFTTEAA